MIKNKKNMCAIIALVLTAASTNLSAVILRNGKNTTPPEQECHRNKRHELTPQEISGYKCSICQDTETDEIVSTKCNHSFHSECLLAWLDKHNHCPLCRMQLIGREGEPSEISEPSEQAIPESDISDSDDDMHIDLQDAEVLLYTAARNGMAEEIQHLINLPVWSTDIIALAIEMALDRNFHDIANLLDQWFANH
jgi:hypothetical protein